MEQRVRCDVPGISIKPGWLSIVQSGRINSCFDWTIMCSRHPKDMSSPTVVTREEQ